MIRGWIDTDLTSKVPGVLSLPGLQKALPYALVARDVYCPTASSRGGAALIFNWIELFQAIEEKSLGLNRGALQTFLGRLFGFNAALYDLRGLSSGVVLAFEGSQTLQPTWSPTRIAKMIQDWLLTNTPATLDVLNNLEPAFPGLFSIFLNPRRAPSTQYDVADILTQQVIKRYGKEALVLTGHSLGGGLAQYAAIRNGVRAIVFNSAGVGFRVAPSESYSGLICHLMTTNNPIALKQIQQIITGRALQAVGAMSAFSVPGNLPLSVQMFSAGGTMANVRPPEIGGLMEQLINNVVTTYTNPLSRHFGVPYVLGYGGHGMDDVLRLLQASRSA